MKSTFNIVLVKGRQYEFMKVFPRKTFILCMSKGYYKYNIPMCLISFIEESLNILIDKKREKFEILLGNFGLKYI